jgi:hypothetical protein
VSEHSTWAPSGLDRLVHCTGSHDLCALYPEAEDSPKAMEGTAAHEVVANMMRGQHVTVGSLASNGIAITEEMIEGAELFCDEVPDGTTHTGGCHVEERVEINRIHPDCWGTPDAWYLRGQTVVVLDYKFGHGFVDEFENIQLMSYAVGVLDTLGLDDTTHYVALTIVQPRYFVASSPVRTWGCLASDLRGHMNRIRSAVAKAEAGDGICTPGGHCRNCSAAHACLALQRSVGSVFDFTATPAPAEMTPTEKGVYLARVEQAQTLLKAMHGGLTEEVEASIRRGVFVPGWDMKPGQGKTGWVKPIAEVAALGEMLGVSLRKDALITPIQAVAALKKMGIDGSILSPYSASTVGALKLVQSDTRRIFGGSTKE